jgi:hypothetical protein
VNGSVGVVWSSFIDDSGCDVILGDKNNWFGTNSSAIWTTTLNGEQDSIPFALNTFWVADIAVAVEVKCQRTDRALMKWKHETHAKITQAV